MRKRLATLLSFSLLAPLAFGDEGPRTGYFQISVTPLELLGEAGATAVSTVFAPDEKLTWQLSVPENYDPEKPAGAIVFIGYAEWGGGKRVWKPILNEKNIIWIGLIGGGDKNPLNERMLKAILAQAVLMRDYSIDPERYYLFGYSGGAHVAAILATTRPEIFKGALYYGDALSWAETAPPKIDLIRQNNFMFMAGARDDDVREIRRVAETYKDAGIANTETFFISNVGREMPSETYFTLAIDFLDSGLTDHGETE